MIIKAQVTGIGEDSELWLKLFGGDMSKIKLNQIIDVNIKQRQRSINQHNFYHLFIEFCLPYYRDYDPTMTHDELHMYFRNEILGYTKIINGDMKRFSRSTTELGMMEFCEFLESCFVKAIEDAGAPIGVFQQDYEEWKRDHDIAE